MRFASVDVLGRRGADTGGAGCVQKQLRREWSGCKRASQERVRLRGMANWGVWDADQRPSRATVQQRTVENCATPGRIRINPTAPSIALAAYNMLVFVSAPGEPSPTRSTLVSLVSLSWLDALIAFERDCKLGGAVRCKTRAHLSNKQQGRVLKHDAELAPMGPSVRAAALPFWRADAARRAAQLSRFALYIDT